MTALEALIEHKLGKSIEQWLGQNADLSYRQISDRISEETGIYVSKSTIFLWLKK